VAADDIEPAVGVDGDRGVTENIEHYHRERTHQGKENKLLFPLQPSDPKPRDGPSAVSASNTVRCRERLGGLLKFYYKEAA
jgi:hypothetical protein